MDTYQGSDPSPAEAIDFHDALARIVQASKLPAKQRSSNIKPTVGAFTSLLAERGVSPEDLHQIISLVTTPSYLDQASLAAIVRNLYPATVVSDESVITLVGCLGHGKLKPSLAIQGILLRWLVMVHHVIDKPAVLAQAYSVLFNLLDTAALRPQLCHILAIITRRRHVRPYRIQNLLSLSRQTGHDPALVGLLRAYKDYYPEIIVGDAVRGKASAFKFPDPEWRMRLDQIQVSHAEKNVSHTNGPREAFRVFRNVNRGLLRKGNALVPEVHTSHVTEESVTLEEIENVDGFVDRLEKIELPNQLVAVLHDPLLQKLLMLRPDADAHQRAVNWLMSYAQDLDNGHSEISTAELFDRFRSYVTATKRLPPAVLGFFVDYLKIWDGKSALKQILETLSYIPVMDFADLYENLLKLLESKMLDSTPESQLRLLYFYTALLRYWMVSVLSAEVAPAKASPSIEGLARHVNRLCLTVLQTSPGSASAQSAVLEFFEQATALAAGPDSDLAASVRLTIPPSPLVYLLTFSASPAVVSRLCGVLASFKKGIQALYAKQQQSQDGAVQYDPEYVNEFNGFLMDICNCLWRSKAFTRSDRNAHGCLVAASPVVDGLASYIRRLRDEANGGGRGSAPLAALFSLTLSPAFGRLATAHLRELEDRDGDIEARHAGPVTRASLAALADRGGLLLSWDEYRRGVLGHLDDRGMDGVGRLLRTTMTKLIQSSSQSQSQS